MKYIRRAADGGEAIPDDMPPHVRAFALLIEHANQRRDDELPMPCPCEECQRHRGAVRCSAGPDNTLIVVPA
jgi:hypothetical protein